MIIPADARGRVPIEVLAVPDRECRVRGGMVRAHLGWVKQQRGPKGLDAVWERLGEPGRSTPHTAIHAADWVPFAFVVAMDRAVAQTFPHLSEESVYVELGRFSAQRNFMGTGLDLARGVNVHSHFWTGDVHHAQFQDFGRCAYVPLDAQAFRMDYREYPVMSRVFCISAQGYFEASVRLLGRQDPIVKEAFCQCYGDPTCSFVVSWE